MLMTRTALLDICKEHKLYRTPSLNDKLYCNFKGFTNIASLEEYTGLRALFLEGNALDSLEGLPPLKELRCLYVQQNSITHISGLEVLENLDTLNISQNYITMLEGLACCPTLRTLICTHNRLASLESVAHVAECKALHTLDLQSNNIEDPAVIDILKQLPELKCLYLKGNPVVTKLKNYRKTLIAALPTLTYLDDRPVFEDERRLVNAWSTGGLDAEREERRKIREEESSRNQANFEAMQEIRKAGWRKRREALGLPEGDGDPALEEFSDDEYVFTQEPAELVEARKRLAAYTAQDGVEEPPELAEARQGLVRNGQPVQEGSWGSGGAQSVYEDAQVYLDAIKHGQEELKATAGTAAAAAHEGKAAPAAPEPQAATGGAPTQADAVPVVAEVEVDLAELD